MSLWGPILRHCVRVIWQRRRAIGNTVSDLAVLDLILRSPAAETNALPLDQLASDMGQISNFNSYLFLQSNSYRQGGAGIHRVYQSCPGTQISSR